jgi:hypothetical protein
LLLPPREGFRSGLPIDAESLYSILNADKLFGGLQHG